MDTLRIGHLELHHHLPPGQAGESVRLEAAVRRALDERVELALERAGLPATEELCVRSLQVPVRVSLGATDDALAERWANAFAAAVKQALAAGSEGVVRYRSQSHALVDVLTSVARGDLRRAWAWRLLSLWPLADGPHAAGVVELAAAQALASQPRAVVPVLAELARAGVLETLWRALPEEAARALAVAALEAVELAPAQAAALLEVMPLELDAAPASPSLAAAATRWAARSQLAGSARAVWTSLELPSAVPPSREDAAGEVATAEAARSKASRRAEAAALRVARALSLLSLVELDPGLVRGAEARARVVALETALARVAKPGVRFDATPHTQDLSPTRVNLPHRTPALRRPADVAEPEALSASSPAAEAPELEADWPAGDVRQRAVTRRAGLLFFLHLVRDGRLVEHIGAEPAFEARTLRWVLHALALRLVKADGDDPAVLAFCGLRPEVSPPSRGEPGATEAEEAALDALRAQLVAALVERFENARDPLVALRRKDPEALVGWLCERRGEVLADPGWLEVRLAVEELSTDIRRAGLDLDLGWLPFLGVVLRFTYG